jgi:geranylgeranyl pyrophosphate synthase
MRKTIDSEDCPRRKLMEEILTELARRSKLALSLARKEITAIEVESQDGRGAFEHHAANWTDYTHPGILSVACEAVGGEQSDALPMQLIILLLTAAIDIHDDIIDETETKNGKLTVYGRFGKDVALLTGDALWMRGFMLLCKYIENLPPSMINPIVNIIQDTLSQVGDAHLIESKLKTQREIKPDEYLRMVKKKGANIELLMEVGAIIGRGSPKEVKALGHYGKILGSLITLREEFIDMYEPEELQNKIRTKCLPLPILYALEDTRYEKEIAKMLSQEAIPTEVAEKIVDVVFKSKGVEALLRSMQTMSERAIHILSEAHVHYETMLPSLAKAVLEDLRPRTKYLT